MNGKCILSKPIYVRLSSNNDNSLVIPSTSPNSPTYSAATSIPYPNIPTMFYVPIIMVPRPSNNLPLPMVRMPPTLSSPPPPSSTQTTRQAYSYNRVRSDDQ